MCIG
jgi:hypothetical protein